MKQASRMGLVIFFMQLWCCAQDPLPDAPSALRQQTQRLSLCDIAKLFDACPGKEALDKAAVWNQRKAEAEADALVLRDGVRVHLRVVETLDSSQTKAGQRALYMQVVEDVKVGDLVVIPRGARAWAQVAEQQGHRNIALAGMTDTAKASYRYIRYFDPSLETTPTGGSLTVEMDGVRAITGETVHLRGQATVHGDDRPDLQGSFAEFSRDLVASFSLLSKGEHAIIPKGSEIIAFVDGTNSFNRGLVQTLVPMTQPEQLLIRASEQGKAIVHLYRVNDENVTATEPVAAYGSFSGQFNTESDSTQWSVRKTPHWLGGKPQLLIDDEKVTKLPAGTYLTVAVDGGIHTFKSGTCELPVFLAQGKECYLRLYRRGRHLELGVVDVHNGEKEMAPLEQVRLKLVEAKWLEAVAEEESDE